MRAQIAGQREELGRLHGQQLEILLPAHVKFQFPVRLQDFAGANRLGARCHRPADFGGGESGGQLERVGEQRVAQQDRDVASPVGRQRGPLPPHLRLVHHVVVHQRGEMDHLDDGGDCHMLVPHFARRGRAQRDQRRPQLLALIRQGIVGILGDLRVKLVHLRHQPGRNRLQERLDRLDNAAPIQCRLLRRMGP